MLKSFIIKLRHKPKAVRDQIALIVAITFTVGVLGIWIFSVPERFSSDAKDTSPGIFSELKDSLTESAPDMSEVTKDLPEIIAAESEEEQEEEIKEEVEEVVIPNEYPTTTEETNTRAIRLATTSSNLASTTEDGQ